MRDVVFDNFFTTMAEAKAFSGSNRVHMTLTDDYDPMPSTTRKLAAVTFGSYTGKKSADWEARNAVRGE